MKNFKNGLYFLLFILSACAIAPKAPENIPLGDYGYLKEYMRWFIEQDMKKGDITGLSIALIDGQNIVWSEGFGYADKEKHIKATRYTRYRAGSVSKLFNATAIMQLAEQGKLDIDQPLTMSLPEFSIKSRFGSTNGITLRSIMTHHSGLPSNLIDGMWSSQPSPFTQVVSRIRDEYVAFPSGKILSYSNLGITLSGHAVERVSGVPYAEHLHRTVLAPLTMNDSDFSQVLDGELAATGYRDGKPIKELPLRDIPAGGLNTTVMDLSRLVLMVHGEGRYQEKQILQKNSLTEMLTPQNSDIELDFDQRIGLGWFFFNTILNDKEPVVGHSGQTLAHSALLLVAPESQIGVVILSNSPHHESHGINHIGKEILRLAHTTKTGNELPEIEGLKDGNAVTSLEHESEHILGMYSTIAGLAEVIKESGGYTAKALGRTFNLILAENGKYYLQYRFLGLIPVNLGNLGKVGLSAERVAGHPALVGVVDGKRMLIGERLDKPFIPDIWLSRLGEYEVVNPMEVESFRIKAIEIQEYSGFLVLKTTWSTGQSLSAIRPINDYEAIIMGLGRGFGETIRIETHAGIETMKYAGRSIRRVVAESLALH